MSKDLSSNNGRWTDEEHNLFLQGLEQFGKNWKLIEKLIKTRTGSQIRSHAQKYYLKMQKQTKPKEGKQRSKSAQISKFNDEDLFMEIKLEEQEELLAQQKQQQLQKKFAPTLQSQLPPAPIFQQPRPSDLELQQQHPMHYQMVYPPHHQILGQPPMMYPPPHQAPQGDNKQPQQYIYPQQQQNLQHQQILQNQQYYAQNKNQFSVPPQGQLPQFYPQPQMMPNYGQQLYGYKRPDYQNQQQQINDNRKESECIEQSSTAEDQSAEQQNKKNKRKGSPNLQNEVELEQAKKQVKLNSNTSIQSC